LSWAGTRNAYTSEAVTPFQFNGFATFNTIQAGHINKTSERGEKTIRSQEIVAGPSRDEALIDRLTVIYNFHSEDEAI
jgi:hypothetical protein